MAKRDLGKILTTGSTKQKLLLLAENVARGKYFQEKLLTDFEVSQLSDSFKKPNEIKLWNEFRSMDERVTTALTNMQSLTLQVIASENRLRGYVLLWNALENAELLSNTILHEVADEQERKRIAKRAIKGVEFFHSETGIDSEGYVAINIDRAESYFKGAPSLKQIMSHAKEETEKATVRYLSWEKATLDYMDENGFNVKTYKNIIKKMTQQVTAPKGWGKYTGEMLRAEERASANVPYSERLQELVKEYGVFPKVEELRVDEVEYQLVKKYYLEADEYPEALRGKVNEGVPNE